MKLVTPQLLSEMVSHLVDALHPREVYLFGSRASGEAGPRSDVDLLVVMDDDAADLDALTAQGYVVLSHFNVPVDLVVVHESTMTQWTQTRFSLPYEARHHGKRLYAA